MTESKSYKLEDIEKAFWSTFHSSSDAGDDVWVGIDIFNESTTQAYWEEFLEFLKARTK